MLRPYRALVAAAMAAGLWSCSREHPPPQAAQEETPAESAEFSAKFACGTEDAEIESADGKILLRFAGEEIEMRRVEAASGAKYEAVADATTVFWDKGDRATLTLRGREVPECVRADTTAGDGSGLAGREWVVEDIAGGGVVDDSRATLQFGEDGRVGGRGSCNSYTAPYTVSGESLTIGQAVSTKMACAPALMEQETKLFDILAKVDRFELDTTGALILHASDGRTVLARR